MCLAAHPAQLPALTLFPDHCFQGKFQQFEHKESSREKLIYNIKVQV
jgi:hypothetical protein